MASASAAVNDRVYYDTLTELDADAKNLIDHQFRIPVSGSLIASIFANNKPLHMLQPPEGKPPIIIITAGSPGVGKSTVAKEQFEQFEVDPHKVYTVSMDTLLERNQLFRNQTKQLYNKVHSIKGEFTNENYATFSGIPATAYKAKQANFKIPEKIASIQQKYAMMMKNVDNATLFNEFEKFTISGPKQSRKIQKKPKSLPRSRSRSRSRSPSKSRSPSRSRSPPKSPVRPSLPPPNNGRRRSSRLRDKPKKGGAITLHLDDIRNIGFEYGVANGLNILYDCTLTSTGNRMNSIMEILEKYAKRGRPRYQIKVILIKADNNLDKAAEIIQNRIRGRHHQMVHNGFLRALTTSIGAIKGMIKQNKEGYDTAKEKYKEIVNPPYEPDDFEFKEIVNKPR
jgi:hypothetical protein